MNERFPDFPYSAGVADAVQRRALLLQFLLKLGIADRRQAWLSLMGGGRRRRDRERQTAGLIVEREAARLA